MRKKFVFLALLLSSMATAAFGGALNPTHNWMTEVFQSEAWWGAAVGNAGDVNGDGYDDMIVSAKLYDTASSGVGMVRVFHGSATGLSTSHNWVVTGSAPGGEFGTAVTGAGDVNGDGYDDVIVSSAGQVLCCYTRSGSVYLYLGSATGLATSPARTYTSGEGGFNYFGERIAGLGDVNLDGYDDFAAGSRSYSNGQSGEGAVFIYYGAATPPSSAGLILEGSSSSAQQAIVRAAGDVNGDTYPDVLVRGAIGARIYYGSASGVSSTPAWQVGMPTISNYNGPWALVDGAGDVNNDGFADVLVADYLESAGTGRVHVFHGSASGLPTTPTFTFVGGKGEGFGGGLGSVGDVDGDGYSDVVITASAFSNGQAGEGRAFLYRGSASGLSPQFAWTGEPNNAGAAMLNVAGADVNDDGLSDAIIGAHRYANHGATFVFHGTAATCTVPDSPTTLAVSATADAQLTLTWTPVANAHHSVIYRALAACGSGTMQRIGETQSNVGTYVDTTALPGGLYSYVVSSATAANTCESAPGPCDDETVTGTCNVKPTFAGVTNVTLESCGYRLSWSPAVSNCPAPRPIRYHVYSNGWSDFTPGPSNRIASCVEGTSFLAPVYGSTYYVVRAEEGGCTGSNEETNSLRHPSPASPVALFDDMEDPRTPTKDAYWQASGVYRTNCKFYSGSRAWRFSGASFCNSYNAFEQNTLTLGGNGSVDPNINGFVIPQAWRTTLTFQHYYSSVSGRDGALLQYATGTASNWQTVPSGVTAGKPYIVFNGYNGTIRSGTIPAWTGTNGGFSSVSVNADALAGQRVWFRWVWMSDGSSSTLWGYYVDQVQVSSTSSSLSAVSLATTGPKTICSMGGGTVVTATPNGGGPPYTYDWGYRTTPGGPITPISNFHQANHTVHASQFNGGAPGTYYLVSTVTPVCGPTTVSSEMAFTITENLAPPAVTPSGPTTFCSGGSVTLAAPAGFASYLWSNGATTPSIIVTQSGSYSVQVTDVSGCSATSAATTVTVQAAAVPVITPSGPTTFCAGGSVTLTASGGQSFLWSNGATTQAITVNASGSYSVTVTDASSCSATSAPTAVTAHPAATTPVVTASGPTTFCAGGSVTLTASGGQSFVWSNGATTQSISVTASGTYSVTVTDANGCSAVSADTTVTVNPVPEATIAASGATAFCAGGSVTLTASEGQSFVWSNGATTQSINVTASGSYSVTVTGTHGCSATSAATTVTVNALPTPSITPSGSTSFCQGGSVTLTAPAAASYLWSDGAMTQSITVSASDSYSVTVTDANGCSGTSSAVTVTVFPLPAVEITASGSTICAGGSVTLTASEAQSYLWSNGATTRSISVGTAGTYTVTVSDGTCSNSSAPVTIVDETTTVTVAGSDNQLCPGEAVTVTSTVTGTALSYQWYGPGGAELPGETNPTLTMTPTTIGTGEYFLRITAPSGCVIQSNTFVYQVSQPEATVTANGPATFCQGGSVELSAPDQPDATYLWSNGATSRSISVSASGSYSVTVTNVNGCNATSEPTVVTVHAPPPAPVISASGPLTFCAGGSVTLTAPDGYTYAWSTGETTRSIAVTTSGTYSVFVSDANGCSSGSDPAVVTVNANPSTPSISASGATTFCDGGSVTLTAPAGYSYLWSNGATTESIIVAASGSYSVTVTNASGCAASSAAAIVTVNANPATPSITPSGSTTFCEGGSVTLMAPEGQSFVWSNGATTQSIVVSTSGSYSVTVSNGSGCSATSAATSVAVHPNPAAPSIGASGSTTFCEGGSVTLTAPAGYSYLWSNGATSQSIVVTAGGSYSVTVTNASGCSATSAATSVTVNANPSTPVISASGSTTFCEGGSVTLTAPAGYSYLWSNGATSQSIVVTAGGSYSATVTNASGCSAASAPTSVTVNATPSTPSVTPSGSTTFCAGGSVTLTAPSGYSYLWSNGATSQSINVSSGGSYSVTVTNASGCSATSAPTAVTVNANPSTPSVGASGPTTFCAGGSVTLTAPGGYSYLWSNGATSQSINVTTGGSYSVTVTNASGCSATSAPTTVTVNAAPSTPTVTAGSATTFCAGGSVTLTAPAGYSYLWSNGATSQSISATTSGSYSVTVTNGSGCSTTSATTNVTVHAVPSTPSITPSGSTTFCAGGSVTLTAPSGFSYLWSNGATSQSINVTAGGSYSVTVTNANGCSSTSSATTVTVHANPATPSITPSGATTFCAGGSVTLTAPGGYSYLWSNGATSQSIVVTSSGSHSVTVTNASGCSATSTPMTVTVNSAPSTPTITPSGATTFCTGGSVTLTASSAPSYLWSNGATTQSINVTTGGSYSVTVTNASGCSATSAPTTVTVNAKPATPSITPSGPTTFCTGGSVTLNAPAGFSYLWSNGATSQSINVTTSGSHSVTVTNASGCSSTSATTTVTVNAAPATPAITPSGATTFCAGGSVTLNAPAGYTYLWSNGATTQSINVTTSGSYSVTVSNANGCSATSAPTTVTVNAKPATPAITPSGPTTFCTGGSVTLSAPAGFTYLWSNGATSQSVNVATSGTFSVTVTNASGCSTASAPTTVTVNAKPATPTVTAGGPTTFCAGGSVTLSAPAGFTYLWSNGATTQSISATTSGNYSVTVTNASGCSTASAATSVTVNPATTISQQPQSVTIARNTTTTLSVTASGTGTVTYQWYRGTSGTTTNPVSGATSFQYTTPRLGKGTYTYWVRVTSSCGSVNSSTATVSVP
jgi:hypothetical protein